MNGRANPTVEGLRRSFDASFADETARSSGAIDSFITLTVGVDKYALRVHEIAGLTKARKIVAFPSPIAELLGVAGIRATLLPVYSLAALLGYPPDGGHPAWFVQCKSDLVVLAFSNFDGYVEQASSPTFALESAPAKVKQRPQEVLRIGGTVRGVIAIPRLVAAIIEKSTAANPGEES